MPQVAAILAQRLHAPHLVQVFEFGAIGSTPLTPFVRNTMGANKCEVMMEVPAGYGRTLLTRPWYRSSYVFVYRKDRGISLHSFDDESLRALRIGVQMVGDDYANTQAA